MTDEEFALGVDAILLTEATGHAAHRALDLWWTRYATEKGGALADATQKWMAHIAGDHCPHKPYPLGARHWWQFWKPRPSRLVRAQTDEDDYGNWTCP